MFNIKDFASAVSEIAEERGISQEKIFEVIEEAIASAYKKEYGRKKQKVIAKLDPKSGGLHFWQIKQVVDESMIYSEEELEAQKAQREAAGEIDTPIKEENEEIGEEKIRFNPDRHIMLGEAKEIDEDAKLGEEIKIVLEAKDDFGRIAAQTAKQVILQKIKEAEKEETFKEFKDKEGEVVSGIVQRVEPHAVYLDIGRTSGILPQKEQIWGEKYRPGQRLKLFVLSTEATPKGPQIVLSRIYPKLISKLFELEVPEISANQVEIKAIAREAGSRSKIAVAALEEGIDPIGSMVGQRGTRIMAVTNELAGEKIDVIEWSQKPETFIANSLSPAKVLEITILPKNKAQALIPDDQISLAIGKEGQNVRLAAKLTGWKIDVKSVAQAEQEIADKKAGIVKPEEETSDEDQNEEQNQVEASEKESIESETTPEKARAEEKPEKETKTKTAKKKTTKTKKEA